jgi:hypothetical protein
VTGSVVIDTAFAVVGKSDRRQMVTNGRKPTKSFQEIVVAIVESDLNRERES